MTNNQYPVAEREKMRRTYTRVSELAMETKRAAERGLTLSAESEAVVAVLTKTSDMSQRYNVLQAVADDARDRHLSKLKVLAPTEFAAYCEFMIPDEPPESTWHQFLTTTLQDIEYNPDRHRVILNTPPGHAKPIHVNTPVLMGNGSWKLLKDIKVGEKVVSHTGKNQLVTAVHEQGVLPILRITTAKGRVIDSAFDHPFWVSPPKRGYGAKREARWTQAQDLRPGDRLTIVHKPSRKQHPYASNLAEAKFAAVAQARGSMSWILPNRPTKQPRTVERTPSRSYYLSLRTEELASEIDALVTELGFAHTTRPLKLEKDGHVLRIHTQEANRIAKKYRLDDRQETKRVPEFIMNGTEDEKLQYLSTYFSMCGQSRGIYKGSRLYLCVRSLGFAADIQKLLGWFAIDSMVDTSKRARNMQTRLTILGDALTLFLKTIQYDGRATGRLNPAAMPAKADEDEVLRVEIGTPDECRCLTVETDHTFIANGVVVHNSTYASRLFVSWRLGRDPNQRIIGGGHSQTFCVNEFSKKIRDLVGSSSYKEIFPAVVISQHTRGGDQWNLAGTKGQYVARGVGQGVHGFRATFILVDDPYPSIEVAESAVQRAKVNTWFVTDIGSRVLPGGKVFVVMTRFNEDDLTGYLMNMNDKLPAHDRWELIEASAICYDEESDIMKRKLGEVLWDYYDLSYFQTKKAELTYQRFSLIYQQLADASSADSVAGSFRYYTHLPHQTPDVIREAIEKGQVDPETGKPVIDRKTFFRRVVLSIDTAAKTTERADWTVIQAWGETHDRKHYLFDQKRVKVEFNRMIEEIERMARRWSVDSILVEDKGQGTAYLQARGQTDAQRRLAPAPLIAISPGTQSKEFRFDEICPLIEAGEVYLPEDAEWLDGFIREVGQFPDGAHDDQCDSLSQYLRWAKSTRTRYGSKKVTSMG